MIRYSLNTLEVWLQSYLLWIFVIFRRKKIKKKNCYVGCSKNIYRYVILVLDEFKLKSICIYRVSNFKLKLDSLWALISSSLTKREASSSRMLMSTWQKTKLRTISGSHEHQIAPLATAALSLIFRHLQGNCFRKTMGNFFVKLYFP